MSVGDFLGILHPDSWELTNGAGFRFNATRDEALQVLYHLRDTGRVDWNVVPRIAKYSSAVGRLSPT